MSAAFQPVKRASIARQVTEQIRRQILGGALQPGDRIPPERALSGQVGSNRNTVREALRTLEQLNLVQVRHGDGVVVRDFRRDGDFALLPFFLAEASDPAEVSQVLADVLGLRRLVLGVAAASAAERSEPEDVARLEAQAGAAPDPGVPAWRQELDFFRALVQASRSLVAGWMFNTFSRAFAQVMERLPGLWVETEDHRRAFGVLVAAVKRRRPAEARRALERHFDRVDREVLQFLSPRPAPGTRAGRAKGR